jgi:protein-tyrosine kinase
MVNTAHNISPMRPAVAGPAPGRFDLGSDLVMLDPSRIPEAEAFRALRTHLMARHVEAGRRALAVCADTGGVGCTYVAANLAVALSQIGVNTLLIDANLRNSGIERLFIPNVPGAPPVGLAQCLVDDQSRFSTFIQPEVLPGLSIMFAGGALPNAQELLASERFHELMDSCLRDYDVTVLDTPQANVCSDAIRVSSVVGYSLIVARRNKTLVNDLRTLIGQLQSAHARVVGTVMTEF